MSVALIVALVLGVPVVLYGLASLRGRRNVRRHALTLAIATGQDVSTIEREIFTRKITPGDWAAEHGLDPATFQPRPGP